MNQFLNLSKSIRPITNEDVIEKLWKIENGIAIHSCLKLLKILAKSGYPIDKQGLEFKPI